MQEYNALNALLDQFDDMDEIQEFRKVIAYMHQVAKDRPETQQVFQQILTKAIAVFTNALEVKDGVELMSDIELESEIAELLSGKEFKP